MTLAAPHLDDRTFQNLVDDAKRLVQRRCPTWTDHNVSDPGVTLIEAVATMIDQLLYRLNRVPERHYLKLLELLGVQRYAPSAARAEVTFWLTAPQAAAVRVPAGTEVATVRTTTDDALIFTSLQDLAIVPCERQYVVTVDSGDVAADRTGLASIGAGFPAFGDHPVPGDTMCVGLSAPVPNCAVAVHLACSVDGVGVDPRDPPLVWEAWTLDGWVACEIERDDTLGLNQTGDVVVHVPSGHAISTLAGTELSASWLRCRLTPTGDGPTYSKPPRIQQVEARTIGGTTEVVHAHTVDGEHLGSPDGVPGQRFALRHPPVIDTGRPIELESADADGWARWTRVDSFADSGPDDRHFVLDAADGTIQLGPAVREVDGRTRQYGAVPDSRAALRVVSYSSGGGTAGNVPARAISVLRSSLPRIGLIGNRRAARGGTDTETAAEALSRAPLLWRDRTRAVTAGDYEHLVRSVAPELARVHCLTAEDQPGTVRVLVIPDVPAERRRLELVDLVPTHGTLERLRPALEAARAAGSRVIVEPPLYVQLVVVATVTTPTGATEAAVIEDASSRLTHYFDPLRGGPSGRGWPLGRAVTTSDVYALLQASSLVESVDDARLFWVDPETGRRSPPVNRIDLEPTATVLSLEHQILVARR